MFFEIGAHNIFQTQKTTQRSWVNKLSNSIVDYKT